MKAEAKHAQDKHDGGAKVEEDLMKVLLGEADFVETYASEKAEEVALSLHHREPYNQICFSNVNMCFSNMSASAN